ncbi:MAG: hypothetical protein ABIP48_06670 [Planctomycetota bacterium]
MDHQEPAEAAPSSGQPGRRGLVPIGLRPGKGGSPFVLAPWCEKVFGLDFVWLCILAVMTVLLVPRVLGAKHVALAQWLGLLLSIPMICTGILGDRWLLNGRPKGIALAWTALALAIPVQAIRLWITQSTAGEIVHPASIFAKHPEYATIPFALWALAFDLLYLFALRATGSAFRHTQEPDVSDDDVRGPSG